MKTVAATAIAVASLIVAVAFAAPALGTGAGAGTATHYTVHCANASGTTVDARSFDARLVGRPGGAHAIEIFKQAHPSGHCWTSGPHRDRPGTASADSGG